MIYTLLACAKQASHTHTPSHTHTHTYTRTLTHTHIYFIHHTAGHTHTQARTFASYTLHAKRGTAHTHIYQICAHSVLPCALHVYRSTRHTSTFPQNDAIKYIVIHYHRVHSPIVHFSIVSRRRCSLYTLDIPTNKALIHAMCLKGTHTHIRALFSD